MEEREARGRGRVWQSWANGDPAQRSPGSDFVLAQSHPTPSTDSAALSLCSGAEGNASAPALAPALLQGASGRNTPPTATFWGASKSSELLLGAAISLCSKSGQRLCDWVVFLQDQVKPLAAFKLETARKALAETVRAAYPQPCPALPAQDLLVFVLCVPLLIGQFNWVSGFTELAV